jgi:hypothetical protein
VIQAQWIDLPDTLCDLPRQISRCPGMTTPPSSLPQWLSDAVLALISVAYETGRHEERLAAQAAVVRGVASVSPTPGPVRTDLSSILQRAELHKIIPAARQHSGDRSTSTVDGGGVGAASVPDSASAAVKRR